MKADKNVIRNGITDPFWQELKKLLEEISDEAVEELVGIDPKEYGAVAEAQQMVKIPRHIIRYVEDVAKEEEDPQ